MASDLAARPVSRARAALPRTVWVLAGGSFVNCLGNFMVPILAMAGLTGLVSELYRPATSAILAAEVPERQRVRAFGVYQVGVSAGTAAGTAIGGLVAEHSFLILFAGDAATSLAWAIGARRVLPGTRATPARGQPPPPGPGPLRDRSMVRLLVVTVLANLILFQAQTTLPLWVHRQGLSTASYGLLLALSSGLLMTCNCRRPG
jgi:predicted MFS family arabinose efflux permease